MGWVTWRFRFYFLREFHTQFDSVCTCLNAQFKIRVPLPAHFVFVRYYCHLLSLGFFLFVFRFNYFYFICMSVWPACMYIHYLCAWCQQRSEQGIGFPGNRVMVIVSCHMGSWIWMQIFCKNSMVFLNDHPPTHIPQAHVFECLVPSWWTLSFLQWNDTGVLTTAG